jgi:hypothetical protein
MKSWMRKNHNELNSQRKTAQTFFLKKYFLKPGLNRNPNMLLVDSQLKFLNPT